MNFLWLVVFDVAGLVGMVTLSPGHEGKMLAGKYLLLERLAGGGMGEVYLAEHHLLKEPRAIKIIREELLGEAIIRQRFMREIEITHKLSRTNKHIVSLYDDYGFEQGLGYYVMEYLEGDTLAVRIRQSPGSLPIDWCVNIAIEICKAMEPVHRAGVIHRDLKPGNIFLVTEENVVDFVKVVDFGVARATSIATEMTSSGVWVGTLSYMSPEQLTWTSEQHLLDPLDGRVDIYALGCILFQMLTGRRPFLNRNPGSPLGMNQMMMAHLYESVPKASDFRIDVSPFLDQVIATAMAKDRTARFPSMLEFGNTLQTWLRDRHVSVHDTIAFVHPSSIHTDNERTYETTSPFARLATPIRETNPGGFDESPLLTLGLATASDCDDKFADLLGVEVDLPSADFVVPVSSPPLADESSYERATNAKYWSLLKWLAGGLCFGLFVLLWRDATLQVVLPVSTKPVKLDLRKQSLPSLKRPNRVDIFRKTRQAKVVPRSLALLRSIVVPSNKRKPPAYRKRRRGKHSGRRASAAMNASLNRARSGQQAPQQKPVVASVTSSTPVASLRGGTSPQPEKSGIECQLASGVIVEFRASFDRALVNIGEMHGLRLGMMACLYLGRKRKSVAPADCIAVAMVGQMETTKATLILARKSGAVTVGMRVCFIKRF